MTIRAFIAIELSPETHDYLKTIQDHLKQSITPAKWVHPENIHLTLKFLGDVKEKNIPKIVEAMEHSLSTFHTFQTTINNIGAFPSPQRPRILWIGLMQNKELVSKMAENLENALGEIGIKKEDREFHPHLTLARVKTFKNLKLITSAFEGLSIEPKMQLIQHITLFKSTLTSQGPTYEKLHTVQLK